MSSGRAPSQLSAHFSSSRKGDGALELEWEDIRFSMMVKDPKKSKPLKTVYKEKQILRGVSGRVASGQLLAIMGPTGCGALLLLSDLLDNAPY
jgi:ABC-type transport system involved in cytochrome bd biosynthesis fused ATPase/permease subunit